MDTETNAKRWLERAEADAQSNEERVAEGFWPKLKRLAAQLPFAETLVAAYYAAFDADTPPRVRAVLVGALAYFVMPIDLFPDVILGLGFTDDLTVLVMAFNMVRQHMKPEHHEMARRTVEELRAQG